jgi:hypothetical protein
MNKIENLTLPSILIIVILVKGYDISFLITNFHTEVMLRHKLVDFVIHFMEVRQLILGIILLGIKMFSRPVFRIRIDNADPNPAIYLNADPNLGSFFITKVNFYFFAFSSF